MSNADDLVLEILDFDWNRLFITPQVVSARISEELGTVGNGEVTLPIDDEAITYLPDPDANHNNEGRWKLYEGNTLVFSGIVDSTTKRINSDNTFSFGGKQRGILLGNTNVGRRDFNGWPVDLLFDELTRDNIAKAPIARITTTSQSVACGTSPEAANCAINCIVGDVIEGNYWAAQVVGPNSVTIDLGAQIALDSARVIPPWWDNRWYKFTLYTSTDGSSFTSRGSKANAYPLSDKGKLIDLTGITARYVKVTVDDSSDGFARLDAVLVYRKLVNRGTGTTFNLSWIENDDSGNIAATGSFARVSEQGAFNGDGVLGNSLVTRLSSGGALTHRFRGTADSVYLTQGENGGSYTAAFRVDGVLTSTVTVVPDTDIKKYQYKAFEVTNLSDGLHTVSVTQVSGTPQVDYFTGLFRSAYRPVNDEDSSIGYVGPWSSAKDGSGGPLYRNMTVHRTGGAAAGGIMKYEFEGDLVKVIGTKGPTFGITGFYIDDSLVSTVDLYSATQLYQQAVFTWSGSFASHSVMAIATTSKNASSTNYTMDIDGIEGNFAHVVYLRSFYETNLRLLDRMSQITNSFNRFNNDGTLDYLGSVGTPSNTVIREGENEGGTIINADIEDDYSETCSAVLALVTSSDGLPLKVFTIDQEAVGRMGLKIRKMDNADANDVYLLQRQAWVELQDHKYPARRYSIQYDENDVGGILVGETTKLFSQSANLDGSEQLRVGRMDTEYTNGG